MGKGAGGSSSIAIIVMVAVGTQIMDHMCLVNSPKDLLALLSFMLDACDD